VHALLVFTAVLLKRAGACSAVLTRVCPCLHSGGSVQVGGLGLPPFFLSVRQRRCQDSGGCGDGVGRWCYNGPVG
jgi:hypothetical protein